MFNTSPEQITNKVLDGVGEYFRKNCPYLYENEVESLKEIVINVAPKEEVKEIVVNVTPKEEVKEIVDKFINERECYKKEIHDQAEPIKNESSEKPKGFFSIFANMEPIVEKEEEKVVIKETKVEEDLSVKPSSIISEEQLKDMLESVAVAAAAQVTKSQFGPNDTERQVDMTINTTINKVPQGLHVPITFSGYIEDDGTVVDYSDTSQNQQNDFVNVNRAAMNQFPVPTSFDKETGLIDNSIIGDRYPQLRPMERAIREEGHDCLLFESMDRLIRVAVYDNGIGNPNASFIVDLNGVVLSPTAKWFNVFNPTEPIEYYCAIPLGRTDLIRQYVNVTADPEELKRISLEMYSIKFLNVYQFVDLTTIPFNVTVETRNLMVDRLYSGFYEHEEGKVNIMDHVKSPLYYKFRIENYAGPFSFRLISESNGKTITVVCNKSFKVSES